MTPDSYKNIQETQQSIERILTFIRCSGIYKRPTYFGHIYEAVAFSFGFLSTFQLLFSIPFYLDDIDSTAMLIYHASLYSATPLAHAFLWLLKPSLHVMVEGCSQSYDYNSPLMEDIQKKIIIDGKTKKMNTFASCLPYMLTFMMSNFFINSILDKFVMGQRYLQLYNIWYPSFVDKDVLAEEYIVYFIQMLSMLLSGFTIFSATATSFMIYNHLTCEFSLLSKSLSLLRERAEEIANREGISLEIAYIKSLNMCMRHHVAILEYFNSAGPAIRIIYTLCYFIGMLLLTCTGFAFTFDSVTVKIKFAVISLIQYTFLYGISWCAQEIATEGLLVNAAAFELDWMTLPQEAKSSLRMLILMSQRPILIRMVSGQPVDLAGYMSLVKASYSYFNMMLVATRGDDVF